MRFAMVSWLLAAPAVLPGCSDPFECGPRPATAKCSLDLASASACTAEGGCWGKWGLRDTESCNCPTTDGSHPCDRSTDCQGACVLYGDNPDSPDGCPEAKQATCSDYRFVGGCRCERDGEGKLEGTCSE